MKIASAEHGQNTCSFHGNFMTNLLSCCGLIDAKIRACDKDLPVTCTYFAYQSIEINYLIHVQRYLDSNPKHFGPVLNNFGSIKDEA